ncbi:uncharacterized protein LOC130051585 [Ostrea edulis]|uniref:uncharacterized protein LOC130051585 n=1 Tax=Ostrea edulis TaxID=37623 RepID=UPI0024AF75B0|nr:uncharacterized protein LOC130051585 [Ostrea edulis]
MDFDFFEALPPILMSAAFIGVLPFGQKAWMRADLSITTAWGLVCILCPKCVMQYQVNGELDSEHEYFYRLFGFVLLSTSLFAVFTQNSSDPTVKVTFLWSRVISTSVYILNRVYSHYNIMKTPQWNDRSWYFGTYGDTLWFLGSLYHTLRCQDWGSTNESNSRLNLHLRIDTIMTFFMALMYFAFPGHVYRLQVDGRLGKLHLSLIRTVAAFLFGSCVISASATRFRSAADKLTFLTCRILTNSSIITFQLIAQFFQSNWSVYHVYFSIMVTALWTFNAGLGYMHEVNRKSKTEHIE